MERRTVRLVLLALALLVLTPGEGAGAIDGVRYCPSTGHWYKRYTSRLTWQAARSNAQAVGGYLATVTSYSEDKFLHDNGFAVSETWLGGTDEQVEGTWTWITGETWSYTNWNGSEPNDCCGGEDYLAYWHSNCGRWNDLSPQGTSAHWADAYIVEWNQNPNGAPDPGPEPGPAPTSVDLMIRSVSFSPLAPAPGEKLRVSFSAQNRGQNPVASCVAKLDLVGFVPDDAGEALDEILYSEVTAGKSFADTFETEIPDDLPSGRYRPRVTLLPLGSVQEASAWDNVRESDRFFDIERPAMPLPPGEKLLGVLGPMGRQEYTVDVVAGLRGSLKAVFLKRGQGLKSLSEEGGNAPLLEIYGKKALVHKLKEAPVGSLVLALESEAMDPVRYAVAFKAKRIKVSGEIEVGAEPAKLAIPGYGGQAATVVLKGLDGFLPALELNGLGDASLVRAKGARASAKKLLLEGSGPWTVRISGAGGSSGRCAYSIKVR